jgi:hypothetical protein
MIKINSILVNLKGEIIYGLSSNKLCLLIIQINFDMYHRFLSLYLAGFWINL